MLQEDGDGELQDSGILLWVNSMRRARLE